MNENENDNIYDSGPELGFLKIFEKPSKKWNKPIFVQNKNFVNMKF